MKSPITPVLEPILDFQVPILQKALVFVGFEKTIPAQILNDGAENGDYQHIAFQYGPEAISYLHRLQAMQQQNPPVAIICDLQFLEEDDYHFANEIAAHPSTKFVPLIALSAHGQFKNKTRLLQNGLDDCYPYAVNWEKLEKRIAFLNQFKPRFSGLIQEDANVRYRVPVAKRAFDIVTAFLLLSVSMPIWLLTAIAIKLESKGPVLYRSKRIGAGYRAFDFLKFRSMSLHADRLLDEYRYLNQYADGSSFVKISNDPRITRVGKFIRKYSIDELPQLLNVLKGDMSIVGNRPLPVYEAETLTRAGWCNRFMAPAGITGLWQVTKRGKANMSQIERIGLDVTYAEEYSFWFDLKILMKTPFAIIQKEHV